MSDKFDNLIRAGRDTDAMRFLAREYYDSGKMGHTRKLLLERVADGYDSLKAKFAVTNYRWIPVSERLPEKALPVLLFLENQGHTKITTGKRYTSTDIKYDGEFCIGFDPIRPEFLKREVVTHWMPLPTPPKGDERDAG